MGSSAPNTGFPYATPAEFMQRLERKDLETRLRGFLNVVGEPIPHDFYVQDSAQLCSAFAYELRTRGTPSKCKGCEQPILWIRTKKGKMIPYERGGVAHFTHCPNANQFRKSR